MSLISRLLNDSSTNPNPADIQFAPPLLDPNSVQPNVTYNNGIRFRIQFTAEEDDLIKRSHAAGLSAAEISAQHFQSVHATSTIGQRLELLGCKEKPSKKRNLFSNEDQARLLKAVEEHGATSEGFKLIRDTYFPDFSVIRLKENYDRINPSKDRTKFSSAEIEIIKDNIAAYEIDKRIHWTSFAEDFLPHRSSERCKTTYKSEQHKSVRNDWLNEKRPDLCPPFDPVPKKRPFNEVESARLIAAVNKMGRQWDEISRVEFNNTIDSEELEYHYYHATGSLRRAERTEKQTLKRKTSKAASLLQEVPAAAKPSFAIQTILSQDSPPALSFEKPEELEDADSLPNTNKSKKNKFSVLEDSKLLKAVNEYGQQWRKINKEIFNGKRLGSSLCLRYKYLVRNAEAQQRRQFTKAESRQLSAVVARDGKNWAEIARTVFNSTIDPSELEYHYDNVIVRREYWRQQSLKRKEAEALEDSQSFEILDSGIVREDQLQLQRPLKKTEVYSKEEIAFLEDVVSQYTVDKIIQLFRERFQTDRTDSGLSTKIYKIAKAHGITLQGPPPSYSRLMATLHNPKTYKPEEIAFLEEAINLHTLSTAQIVELFQQKFGTRHSVIGIEQKILKLLPKE